MRIIIIWARPVDVMIHSGAPYVPTIRFDKLARLRAKECRLLNWGEEPFVYEESHRS